MARAVNGLHNPDLRFVSLLGSMAVLLQNSGRRGRRPLFAEALSRNPDFERAFLTAVDRRFGNRITTTASLCRRIAVLVRVNLAALLTFSGSESEGLHACAGAVTSGP